MQLAIRNIRHRYSGLTIVEVLVVVSILSLLLALLLGGVQQARGVSRRLECSSRLRQTWLGVEQYQETFGNYPTQFLHNYAYFIRPYIESPGSGENERMFPLLRCPSDPLATGELNNFSQISFYMSDGVRGDHPGEHGLVADHNNMASVRRPRDLIDGLSNTAAMAERLAIPNEAQAFWLLPEHEWIRLQRSTAVYHSSLTAASDECIHHALDPGQQVLRPVENGGAGRGESRTNVLAHMCALN